MLDNLDERLMQAKARLRTKQKLEAMMRQAQSVVRQERAKSSILKDTLANEKTDVDKLEGLSLTALFHSVLGTKAETLGKERQQRRVYRAGVIAFPNRSDKFNCSHDT